ncbi:hypothetical protein [Actinocorallia sp. A-T 12471]|uniref:hypothetical protein n=1 Tax=Actinocorallia sp. A-T 12471 TaxID=3089813 RepID=UPI0029D06F8C|nr:hypothetical protein [Actinocorallia sp. A-T 12471]MDX6741671.1 hypothetical protein [Actinocorallia sp. A-T 12471]
MTAAGSLVWKAQAGDQAIYQSGAFAWKPWSNPRQIPNVGSSGGIAATRTPDQSITVIAHQGANSDRKIWLQKLDRETPLPQYVLPFETVDRPAIAYLGDRLCIAFRGVSDQFIRFAMEDGHGGWTAAQVAGLGVASSTHGPAMAVHNGRVFLAWKGSDSNQRLYSSSYDGAWTQPVELAGWSTHGPALASNRGTLHLAYKGRNTDTELYHSASHDGLGWTAHKTAGGSTTCGPSLGTTTDRGVVMAWKGSPGDNRIFWSRDFGPQAPAHPYALTTDTPAITGYDNPMVPVDFGTALEGY